MDEEKGQDVTLLISHIDWRGHGARPGRSRGAGGSGLRGARRVTGRRRERLARGQDGHGARAGAACARPLSLPGTHLSTMSMRKTKEPMRLRQDQEMVSGLSG